MATTTVFGIGGWDPLMSFAEGHMNNYFSRKAAEQSAALQYKYAEKYALNSPSWNVAGLRNAGLNPILAATDGSFSSPTVPNVKVDNNPSNSHGGYDPSVISQLRMLNSQKDLNRASALKEFTDALTKLKTGGFTGHYGALHSLGTSLGFKSGEIDGILRNFGFSPLSKSSPDGSTNSPSSIKSKSHVDVPKDVRVEAVKSAISAVRKDFSKQSNDDRKAGFNAIKEASPALGLLMKALDLAPSDYSMPRPPRSNSLHNKMRKFHRDDKKRSFKNHSWKVR